MQIPYFKRWHPLLALRYLPVVSEIGENDSVLEIGSGSLGIGPYLKREFTAVDIDFSGPVWPKMTKIKASATKLPKSIGQFDVVISMDMLEHLPHNERKRAIEEMMRVSKKKVIIGVPVGRLAHEQDKRLDKHYRKVKGTGHIFLEEQTEFGLPEKKWMLETVKNACGRYKKNCHIKVIPNINLRLREWMMRGWISTNPVVDIFHRKLMLLALPLIVNFNKQPVYRQIFVVNMIDPE